MADNFNLAKFLRNNPLLNESIGGYRDIRPLREDKEFDEWCQDNPEDCKKYKQSQADADKAFTDKFGSYSSDEGEYKVVATNDDNDLDPNAIAKAIPGFDPNNFEILYKGDPYGGWQDNPNTAAVIASLKSKDGEFIAKKNSKLSETMSGEQSMTAGSDWEYKDDEFVTAVGEVDSALGVNVGDVIRNPNGSETLTVKRIVKKVNRGDDPENPKYPIYTAYLDSSIKAGRDEYPFDLYTLSKAIERGGYELNPVKEAKGYIQEIQMEGENPWLDDSIDGKKIGNWVANYDDQMGTVYLEHPMIEDIIVYATPGWEGIEGIALAISEDGEEKPWNEDGIVPGSKSSYESFEEYAADMVDVLNDIEFELTINQMIEGIEKGAGWIDPDYVQDTWENSSDIPFDSVASEIYTRLIDAGLLFYPDEDEPLEAGMQVRSLDQLNEADEEDAYFDYKNNRRSFLPSPDEFQGALDSSEMSQQDFMMSLAHKDFDGDVSAIVKKTIDGLRAGGFDDQDIIDFLATDFSLDEEVSGVQMEGEEFNWKPINQQGKTPFKNLTVTITDDEIKVLADDGFSSQSYTKDDIKKAIKTGEYLRFRGHNLQLNTKMKAWANS